MKRRLAVAAMVPWCCLMLVRPSEGLNHVQCLLPLLVTIVPMTCGTEVSLRSRFLARATAQQTHVSSPARGSELQTSDAKDSLWHNAVRHVTLRDHQAKTPGYYRSYGVRGGVPKAALGNLGLGANANDLLDNNMVTGSSMSYQFRALDDLEPVAPMDRIETPIGVSTFTGHFLSPLYVPGYLKPDAFPVKSKFACNCSHNPAGRDVCTCNKDDDATHFHFAKSTPIEGTQNYTLTAADPTFSNGNYWHPQIEGSIVAPKDRMAPSRYPNQATGDKIWPLPAQAREDRVGLKYARYIDQVAARSEECDTVSSECTVPCRPGDNVVMMLGNTIVPSVIEKTVLGNSVQISFQPGAAAAHQQETLPECPLQASCTNTRVCYDPLQKTCLTMEDANSRSWNGDLRQGHECPKGTSPCRTISMMVRANYLRKDGKACKAAPPKS